MKRKVFLAWQSQNRDTEKYVSNQLDAAKKDLELCGIDTDIIKTPTQDESGSPCITDLIWQQIISSDAFVADLSFMPETTLLSATHEWKKKDVQINKKEGITCIRVQTYKYNEEWIPAFAIRVQNILQSLLDLLQYCGYRITNIDADGNPNGVILLQREI